VSRENRENAKERGDQALLGVFGLILYPRLKIAGVGDLLVGIDLRSHVLKSEKWWNPRLDEDLCPHPGLQ
jgi:hypothetical protein